jgi:hypothetical protein
MSSSHRAPIFYDSNDTGYYADFNSTGTSINIAGSLRAATYNKPAIISVASGSDSSGASFAIQQETAEGWTGIFVDFEPNTGWGLYHDNLLLGRFAHSLFQVEVVEIELLMRSLELIRITETL